MHKHIWRLHHKKQREKKSNWFDLTDSISEENTGVNPARKTENFRNSNILGQHCIWNKWELSSGNQ